MAEEETKPLRQMKRFITDHDSAGKAIFNTTVDEFIPSKIITNGDKFALAYATDQYPVDFSSDLATYQHFLSNLPGVLVPGGSVLRFVDIRPGGSSPMHRTVSLDYGVVLEGEVELVLDSGETRLMRRGDVSVQRGTNHLWRNTSDKQWARMLYILQEAKPVLIGGVPLGEDYGVGMEDVRPSGH